MMLSHSVKTHITTGYIKGTESSDVEIVLKDIQACTAQISHPMLLPVILFSHSLSPACDEKQRNARDWVRKVEKTVTARDDVLDSEGYFQDGKLDLDGLSNSLVETHGQVMWKRPQAYIALAMEMEKGMETFKRELTAMDERSLSQVEEGQRKTTEKLHGSMLARLDFYKVKLTGQESYIHTTLERIKVQREAVGSWYNLVEVMTLTKSSSTTSCPSGRRNSTSNLQENKGELLTLARGTARRSKHSPSWAPCSFQGHTYPPSSACHSSTLNLVRNPLLFCRYQQLTRLRRY